MATSWYVATTGNDGNAGTSLVTAFLTIAHAIGAAASGDTINVQTGTYTQTSALTLTQATLSIIGFQTTAGDGGHPPTITTSTNSIALIATGQNGGTQLFQNLILTSTAGTPGSGIWQPSPDGTAQWWVFNDCLFDGFLRGIDNGNGTPDDINFITVNRTEIRNCSVAFDAHNANTGTFVFNIAGSYFHDNAQHLLFGSFISVVNIVDSIFANGTASGSNCMSVSGAIFTMSNCTVANNASADGVSLNSLSVSAIFTNNIFYGNAAGIQVGSTPNFITASALSSHRNAFNNAGGNPNWPGNSDDIALTADPFTHAAGGDYSLNSAAGGGALCRGAGYPGTFGATSAGFTDVGAVQSNGSGSGSSSNCGYIY